MKYFILLSFMLFNSCIVYSAPMADELGICYKFEDNKLIKKSVCIIHSGYGAGGSYVTLEHDGFSYNIETSIVYDEKTDEYEQTEPMLNGIPATFYSRNLFYEPITDEKLVQDDSLNCIVSKDRKKDICYK